MEKNKIIIVCLMLVLSGLLTGCVEDTSGEEVQYPYGEPIDIIVEGIIVDWIPIGEVGWSRTYVYLEFDDGNIYAVGYMPCPFRENVSVRLSLTKSNQVNAFYYRDLIDIEYT